MELTGPGLSECTSAQILTTEPPHGHTEIYTRLWLCTLYPIHRWQTRHIHVSHSRLPLSTWDSGLVFHCADDFKHIKRPKIALSQTNLNSSNTVKPCIYYIIIFFYGIKKDKVVDQCALSATEPHTLPWRSTSLWTAAYVFLIWQVNIATADSTPHFSAVTSAIVAIGPFINCN